MPPEFDNSNAVDDRSNAGPAAMIWAQPGICENILSHLEADEQVRLMTINENASKAVLGWRYGVVGGNALSHLVSAGTPQYLVPCTNIDITAAMPLLHGPILELVSSKLLHLDQLKWYDGLMSRNTTGGDAAEPFHIEYDVNIVPDSHNEGELACWTYASQVARCGDMRKMASVSRRLHVHTESLLYMTKPWKEHLLGPTTAWSIETDDSLDFRILVAAFDQASRDAGRHWLLPSAVIQVDIACWSEFIEQPDVGLQFDCLRREGHAVALNIKRSAYWECADDVRDGMEWHDLSRIGTFAEHITLSAPFLPLNLDDWFPPPGPVDYSEQAVIRELKYSIRFPIDHATLTADDALHARAIAGLRPYADMIARMCGESCVLVLEAVVEAAEGFDEDLAHQMTPAKAYWQTRMELLVAEARADIE